MLFTTFLGPKAYPKMIICKHYCKKSGKKMHVYLQICAPELLPFLPRYNSPPALQAILVHMTRPSDRHGPIWPFGITGGHAHDTEQFSSGSPGPICPWFRRVSSILRISKSFTRPCKFLTDLPFARCPVIQVRTKMTK